MKKKTIPVLAGILTVFALLSAAGADTVEDTRSFSLQQAVDYALENSNIIKLADTAHESAKVRYKEADKAYDRSEGLSDVFPTTTIETAKLEKGYYKDLAKMGVTLAEKGKERAAETVKLMVQSSYFDLLFAREKVEIQGNILEAAQKNMDIVNKKYDLGMVSQMDVLASEANLETARLSYNAALRDAEYKLMAFNKTLGLPMKTGITLIDTLTCEAPGEANIEEKVAEALSNRFEVLEARGQYEMEKKSFDITASWYPSNTYTHQQAKYQLENMYNTLVDTEQNVELSVRKAYMDMMGAFESIGVLDKNVERLEKAYRLAQLRYDVGMATNQDVINTLNALNEVELQRLQAIHGYNLAKKQFEASCGVGIASAGR